MMNSPERSLLEQATLILEERLRRQRIRDANARLEEEAAADGASLATFTKSAWHVLEPSRELKWGWALDAMSEHLEAVTHGQILRLCEVVPPGMMKSLLTNVFWKAWEIGPIGLRSKDYLNVSHDAKIASRDLVKLGRLLESEWFQERWPVELLARSSTKIETAAYGRHEVTTAMSITGKRADVVAFDEPISVPHANSDAVLKKTVLEFKEALPLRLNDPEKSAIVISGQRVNANDVVGYIEEHKELGYEMLVLPMEFDPERRCRTSIGFVDPRKVEGELLFPERFPRAVIDRDRAALGAYAYAAQMQQDPRPRGGVLFQREWVKTYRRAELPQLIWRGIYADTAMKPGQENDYSVLQCWGATPSREAYLIDQLRGKWGAPELRRRTLEFWIKHARVTHPQFGVLRHLKVEDKASGTGLIQDIAAGSPGVPPIPVVGIPRGPLQSKIMRAHDCVVHFELGRVYAPSDVDWFPTWMKELLEFPNGRHDDQVDPTMDAVTEICGGGIDLREVV